MESPARIPEGLITGNSGTPSDSRPGKSGWTPSVPSDSDPKPYIAVDLTPEDNVEAVPLDKLRITGAAVVTVAVRTTKDGDFQVPYDTIAPHNDNCGTIKAHLMGK